MARRGPALRRNFLAIGLLGIGIVSAAGIARGADAPTFDQVLAAPDDPQINLAYAQDAAQNGHLLNAAAALERILLAHPNAHSVRLFYAAVLYRLNDFKGARQQLKELERVRLTPLQEAERAKYEHLVDRAESATTVTGKVATGIAVESDAIGALVNELDFPFSHIVKNGASVIAATDAELVHALGPGQSPSFFMDASIYTRTSFAGPNADFAHGALFTGLEVSTLDMSFRVGGVASHDMIFDNPYLTEIGGRAEIDWHYSPQLTLRASGEAVHQNYHEPSIDFLVPFIIPGTHDGSRYAGSIGAGWRVDAFSTLSGDIGYEAKDAGYDAFGYDSVFADADYHLLLGQGAYADATGDIRFVDYRANDFVFLFGSKREDLRWNVRAAVGAPISYFSETGATGDWREDLIVEGAVTFADRTTRFPLAAFHSVGGQLRLVYKFGS